MDPWQAFAQLVERDETEVDLGHAALLLAAVEYPALDVGAYLERLDGMADALRGRLALDRSDGIMGALGEYLFDHQGFAGNEGEYYDPRNSYLNDVLDRRLGIPITLSLVYAEVARRLGVRLEGVGLPGHFLLRYPDPIRPVLVDPFNKGRVVDEAECDARLRTFYGDRVSLTPDMLRAVGTKAILFRMLNNLKGAYARQKDTARAVRSMDLMLLVDPTAVGQYRDRGLLHFQAGDFRQARVDLERFLDRTSEGAGSREIREQIALMDRLDAMRN